MNQKEFEATMRCVMKKAAADDFSGFGEEENLCLKECVDKEYIIGIFPSVMASGRIVFDVQAPKITHAGYTFLDYKPDRRPTIAIAISLVALFVSLSTNLDKIVANLAMLLKWLLKG